MKTNLNLRQTRIICAMVLGIGSFFGLAAAAEHSADTASVTTAIPWSQLGAKAGANYQGDALAVIPTAEGARLRCAFQRLEGEATREGLWLTSTVIPPGRTVNDRFRLVAVEVGRGAPSAPSAADGVTDRSANPQTSASGIQLSATGHVSIDAQSVRFTRPGLVEEYTASMDGVRQDFVAMERPPGLGELVLRLAVSGARVESAGLGAQVVLVNTGRKIAYSRLRVTDATGRELPARMEVATALESRIKSQKPEILHVVVNDAAAVYPVCIDPTFSDANWSSMGGIPGVNGWVNAAVVDGSGNLYIGGEFNLAGEVVANHVAKWNGSSWSALGSGIGNALGQSTEVYALAVSGSDLYAGGSFTTAGGNAASNVAKWNGSSWTALGSGMNGDVRALAVSGGELYVGGDFTTAGGNAATNVAKWDGSSWAALGSGMGGDYPDVYALAVSDSDLYVGGYFTMAGGSAATNIAKWDGSSWSALGSGLIAHPDFFVWALAVSGSNVYVGGSFGTAGGIVANNIAKWDGSTWTALGSGLSGTVSALAVSGSDLYAAGYYVAKWNGSIWSALGSGVGDDPLGYTGVSGLAVSGSDVYAGGRFTTAGGSAANNIAKWNGSSWSALGSGMNNGVGELAVSGSDVYAAGRFTTAGGSAATNVAKWNGSGWSALGSGIGNVPGIITDVSSLAVSGNDLYVGGYFTTAGGSAANNIAKWGGSSWSALGSGLNDAVYAVAVSGNDVYVGGYFTTAGGSTANRIAKWDGDGGSWSALGSGLNEPVYAVAVSGNDVYVGGDFTTAGGSAAQYIAKWNGGSWSVLSSGMNGVVYALAVSGNDVYAGGIFTTAGGNTAKSIAKWNGSSWSALGSGMIGGVSALAVSGTDVYAGGYFTTAGGSTATNIAKWDGSSWSALGSGMNDGVSALAVSGSDLYAGGIFTTAGGKVSAYIARAYRPALPTISVLRSSKNVTVSWPTVDTADFTLEQAGPLARPAGWVTNSATVTDDGTNKSVTIPATNTSQFFRLRRP